MVRHNSDFLVSNVFINVREGFPEASGIWQPVIDQLNQNGEFRIYFPDQRGYNRSSRPTPIDAYHIRHLVADIDAVVSAVSNGNPVTLAAHDWGAIVAWTYAFYFPEKIHGYAGDFSSFAATVFLTKFWQSLGCTS